MVGVEIENGPIQRPKLFFSSFQESNSDSNLSQKFQDPGEQTFALHEEKGRCPEREEPDAQERRGDRLADEPFSPSNQKLSAMPSKINSTSAIVIVVLAMTTEANPSTIGTLCFLSR